MKLMQFLEKRLGWLRIPDLPLILCVGYILFFLVGITGLVDPLMFNLCFNDIIENKEYWRLLTFVFNISSSPLFFIFVVAMQWFFGGALERTFGSFHFTLFLITYWVVSVGIAFVFPYASFGQTFTHCVFFAFALIFPNFVILESFVLPIKIKWVALFEISRLLYYTFKHYVTLLDLVMIFLPILLFFGKDIYYKIRYRTRKTIITAKKQVATQKPHHQCVECKITDLMDPKKEFRYIEENNQMKCYCDVHFPTKKNTLGH
jgi:hypothetical protein